MNVSLYQAAAALNANSHWLDVISENLASGSVPGYRKQTLATEAVQAGLMPVDGAGSAGASGHFTLPKATDSTSFKTGGTQYTGDDKNLAIDGAGFFQVELPSGKTAVTRDGEFQVNSKGLLVTKEGYRVEGKGGAPITLDVHNTSPVSITANGQVMQGEDSKGTISLTDYKNPELLTATNGVYFLTNNPHLKEQAATGTLRQGYVEGSNTNSMEEMANMMNAMRTFEANQHVIQIQDDRIGKVITDLGSPASSS